MARDWPPSDEQLDDLRQMGDPVVDDFVFKTFKKEAVRPLMKALAEQPQIDKSAWGHLATRDSTLEEEQLNELLTQLTEPLPKLDKRDEATARKLFNDYGPEILMILGFYSLPAAYSAKNGVQVLAQTRFLQLETDRRLAETAQIIIDVMSKGLGEDEQGREAALRTRLIHSAIRVLLIEDPDFDTETFGTPINQEDLAATLMTFSTLVIEALRNIGIRVTPAEAEAYIDTWRQVGRILGVVDELLPDTFEEAKALTKRIQKRQIKASPEGIELLRILRCTLDDKTVPGLPSAMMRMFLPRKTANQMKVPSRLFPIPDFAVHQLVRTFGLIDSFVLDRFKLRSLVLREASMGLLYHVMDWQKNVGDKPEIEIPDTLDWWRPDEVEPRRNKVSRVMLDTALAGPRGGADARGRRKESAKQAKGQASA